MGEQLTQTGHTQIPSASQVVGQISPPVASHHSETNRSVAKSHHSSQSQEVSRRQQGYKGKNKTTFRQRKRESDPMIQKLLDWDDTSGFTPFRNQQISGQESPLFTIPVRFQEKTRIQGQKQDHLQTEEERVRPNDPEAVGLGERSAQKPEVVVDNFGISSLINGNITPTQIDHNVVTPESNLNSDSLWLQMTQYAEKTQKQFAEI
ncbi:hypothetical protein O181_129570 [Austropuccinia psidii MF-1]|uniref:Uncharacterized protein n=1 Tax=Austropuccinia psidii MF-1 TaxID=1389203 RepID=A0A9Q3L261_9BASI|nr:hypothetical protein [Austropuccinia psidii MF-1]